MIVVDASLAVGWILKQQESEGTEHIYDEVIARGGIGPAIFEIEVANALRNNLRRNKITVDTRDAALGLLRRIGINSPARSDQPRLSEIIAISDQYDLTVYDASYVALARMHSIPIATLDDAMARAARAEGLSVLP